MGLKEYILWIIMIIVVCDSFYGQKIEESNSLDKLSLRDINSNVFVSSLRFNKLINSSNQSGIKMYAIRDDNGVIKNGKKPWRANDAHLEDVVISSFEFDDLSTIRLVKTLNLMTNDSVALNWMNRYEKVFLKRGFRLLFHGSEFYTFQNSSGYILNGELKAGELPGTKYLMRNENGEEIHLNYDRENISLKISEVNLKDGAIDLNLSPFKLENTNVVEMPERIHDSNQMESIIYYTGNRYIGRSNDSYLFMDYNSYWKYGTIQQLYMFGDSRVELRRKQRKRYNKHIGFLAYHGARILSENMLREFFYRPNGMVTFKRNDLSRISIAQLDLSSGSWDVLEIKGLQNTNIFSLYDNTVLKAYKMAENKSVLVEYWDGYNADRNSFNQNNIFINYITNEDALNITFPDFSDLYEMQFEKELLDEKDVNLWKLSKFNFNKPLNDIDEFKNIEFNWLDENEVENSFEIYTPNQLVVETIYLDNLNRACVGGRLIPRSQAFECFYVEQETGRIRKLDFFNNLCTLMQQHGSSNGNKLFLPTLIRANVTSSQYEDQVKKQSMITILASSENNEDEDFFAFKILNDQNALISDVVAEVSPVCHGEYLSLPSWARNYSFISINGYISIYVPNAKLVLFNDGDYERREFTIEEAVKVSIDKYFNLHYGIKEINHD